MKKFGIIAFSFVLSLLMGVGAKAMTHSDKQAPAAKLNKKLSKETKQENDSQDEDSSEIPTEKITKLDFFGAFSLVNVQLQWRDLHASPSTELSLHGIEAKSGKVIVDEVSSTFDSDQKASNPAIAGVRVEHTYALNRSWADAQSVSAVSRQKRKIIDYILNSGTYPIS